MRFNTHLGLEGQHAFLSASKYHWINYDDEKLERVFKASRAAQRGTDLYVNGANGYRMNSDQILYFSENAFCTPDTICFRRNKLRIHDLKTGHWPCSVKQLEVYAALFCLEYRFKPFDIEIELRIYQSSEAQIYEADPDVIA